MGLISCSYAIEEHEGIGKFATKEWLPARDHQLNRKCLLVLCKSKYKDIHHLFFNYSYSRQIVLFLWENWIPRARASSQTTTLRIFSKKLLYGLLIGCCRLVDIVLSFCIFAIFW